MKKKILFLTFCILLTTNTFATEAVDFYATVSSSSDKDMISMTTDLFFTQLQSLESYTVTDRRNAVYSKENAIPSNISFYIEIQEDEENTWLCTLHAIKLSEEKNLTVSKHYSSYYKILLDAKNSLELLLKNISLSTEQFPEAALKNSNSSIQKDAEKLCGTWTGETFIDKIIILRGGRGFVIFKNGASMNIQVNIAGNKVNIVQTGKPNASYFPELPRDLALKAATQAPAIKWDLTLVESNKLKGTKTTLTESKFSENGVSTGTYNVEWIKK